MQRSNVAQTGANVPDPADKGAESTREYYANRRDDMLPFLPARYTRVLEVGCGEGAFAASLAPDSEIWGVEPDPVSAARAVTRLHRVCAGAYTQVAGQLPDAYFDLVVCNDVIEHMVEPEEFLVSMRRKLAPGGHVVASIPNMRHWETLFELLWKKDWRYRQSGTLDRTHLRFYTQKSIERLFTESGFVIERIAGINEPRHPWRRLALLLLSALTLGHYADVRFPQFALRAGLK